MELGIIVAKQVMIMFILIGIGITAFRKGIVTIEATNIYSNFLLVFVVPALIINAYQRGMVKEQLVGLGYSFVLAIVFHLMSIIIVNLLIKSREDNNYRVERMGAIYSNCGFMAFPVLLALLGQEGALYGTAFIGIFNVFSWTNGVAILTGENNINIKKIIFNPGSLGFIIGLILYLTQIPIGSVTAQTISYIAAINTPLAMVITGVFLANIDIKETLKDINIYKSVLLRTIILPLIMIFLIKITGFENWFDAGKNVAIAHIVACSCPAAASTILLVARNGLNSEHGAKLVTMSTLVSIVTIPALTILINLL
ncbi:MULTISPECIES: AEC family transporter [unclassified Clostridium]|uniref:AEC family transporter n=1 Tax=unclassified Clostridium TaxID=2614128 RepID=UPI0002979B35|nr:MULTISPECIES: AEC family transporter [unclassified Clostridium]EKQ58093.1 MAG: putative permease [Clostridium sp. Maddingley MBC34-26]